MIESINTFLSQVPDWILIVGGVYLIVDALTIEIVDGGTNHLLTWAVDFICDEHTEEFARYRKRKAIEAIKIMPFFGDMK